MRGDETSERRALESSGQGGLKPKPPSRPVKESALISSAPRPPNCVARKLPDSSPRVFDRRVAQSSRRPVCQELAASLDTPNSSTPQLRSDGEVRARRKDATRQVSNGSSAKAFWATPSTYRPKSLRRSRIPLSLAMSPSKAAVNARLSGALDSMRGWTHSSVEDAMLH